MIDLHSHTVYSDGSYTVKELLNEAERKGISLLSITDHNSVNAYRELENSETRNLFSGDIIPGVEMTATYQGEGVEVLGYGFDIETMQDYLDASYLKFEEKQLKEFELIKNQYKKVGVVFDENQIKFQPQKENCRSAFFKEICRYKENDKFFLNKDAIVTINDFSRNEVYNPKSPLYVDESSLFLSLEKAIDIIHQSGGVAFLAHLYVYTPHIANELTEIIKNYKLDGLECFYTTFTNEQTDYLVQLCEQKNLFMCGGSDCHGTVKVNHYLGTGAGNLNISETLVENWVNTFKKI